MKKLKKDELYQNLSRFLASKGVELKEGAYASRLRTGCKLLADCVHFAQTSVEKAKTKMDSNLDRMRQIIHEKTAPRGTPKTAKTAKTAESKPAAGKSDKGKAAKPAPGKAAAAARSRPASSSRKAGARPRKAPASSPPEAAPVPPPAPAAPPQEELHPPA